MKKNEALKIYSYGRRDQPKVALTFDDGPNPPVTDKILEILETKKAKATFFVIGKWIDRWTESFLRIVRKGHTIGNHSYSHDPNLGDFDHAESVITNLTGKPSRFLRAHYFKFHLCLESTIALSPEIKIVDADVNPSDFKQTSSEEILNLTMNAKNLQAGSIIDLHDGSETENHSSRISRPAPLVEALPKMIDELQDRGFELVGLEEMELDDPKWWPKDYSNEN